MNTQHILSAGVVPQWLRHAQPASKYSQYKKYLSPARFGAASIVAVRLRRLRRAQSRCQPGFHQAFSTQAMHHKARRHAARRAPKRLRVAYLVWQ